MKIRHTDANKSLTTLVVKHYNDLLDWQTSEKGKDEVTYFNNGDIFCINLGIKYANFQEKNLRGDFLEKVPNFSL